MNFKSVILILLIGLTLTGCIGPTEKTVNVPKFADAFIKNYYKEGWGVSGYTRNNNHTYIKIGEISSPMIYEISDCYPLEQDKISIESMKNSGYIFGIFWVFKY
jgi:hypothetical protein